MNGGEHDQHVQLLLYRVADGESLDADAMSVTANAVMPSALLREVFCLANYASAQRALQSGTWPSGDNRPADVDDAIQQTWGIYKLQRLLGRGSYGAVYQAQDEFLNRPLAIKLLHPGLSSTESAERAQDEARVLARVAHPNVVAIYRAEVHHGQFGICMEYVDGQTLQARVVRDGPLSADEALAVAKDLCPGLATIHAAGVLHRDIKAQNVMRARSGRFVLMDLGAGILQEASHRSAPVGTPLYMAPELFTGAPATRQSDIYSMGVLLYFLVTGTYPVEGQSADAIATHHAAGERVPLDERRPGVPPAFADVVERALSPDPNARFPSALALQKALFAGSRPEQANPTHDHDPRLDTSPGRMLAWGVAPAAALILPVPLGFLSSLAFNANLGRSEFAAESVWDWFQWGVRSSLLPLFFFLVAGASYAVFRTLRSAFRNLRPRARPQLKSLPSGENEAADKLWAPHSVLASSVFLLSSGAFLAAVWSFTPLLEACASTVSDGALEQLRLLSPDYADYHDRYRQTFSLITIASGLALALSIGLARARKETLNVPALVGSVAVTVLSLAALDLPYRLLIHNEFEAVGWRGQTCFLLGEQPGRLLITCPGSHPPRNRVLSSEDEFQRSGNPQSVFVGFGTNPPVSTKPEQITHD